MERELTVLSLREAARQIGLSANALRNFVRGARPRITTRTRIERWLAGRPRGERAVSVAAVARLLGEVTPDLPQPEAAAVGRDLAQALLHAYQRRRLPPPRWVRDLARHYGSSAET